MTSHTFIFNDPNILQRKRLYVNNVNFSLFLIQSSRIALVLFGPFTHPMLFQTSIKKREQKEDIFLRISNT